MASDLNFDEDGDFIMVTDEDNVQDLTTKWPDEKNPTDPEIYEMKIDSSIRHRYARTVVTSKVQNLNSAAREVTFSVILPDKAFISEFVLVIGGKEYKAYVKEKEQAKNIYDQAVATGVAAAHVAVSARESNRFTVSVNVEPLSKATFILTYEELLRRKENMYELIINIHPKQLIKDLLANVVIDESLPLKFVKTPSIRSGNEITTGKGDLDPRSEIHQLTPNTAVVKFKPTLERQKELAVNLGTEVNEGLSGQFVVQYDVERDPTGGEVLVQGGYFVHFFAPSDIKPMNKYIIFVLDTSGSMNWGQKMSQLKQAMSTILDQLDAQDYFHIIGFESIAKVWNIDDPKQSVQTRPRGLFPLELPPEVELTDINFPSASVGSSENIRKAKLVLTELHAAGGTNIYEALKVAMNLIEREKFNVSHKSLPQPIIMFLTDGDPTVGVTDRNIITSDITKFNKNKVPIFSLSFGEDADKNFLKKLSLQNQGFSRHIYEASDAALQLGNFYKEIASPLLSNIKFEYVPETTSLTKTVFPIHFAGSEIIVSGRLHTDTFSCIPRVKCIGRIGPTIFQPAIEKPVSSIERLWAYLTVQQLLDEKEISADKSVNEKKALSLALQYSFVTPVSSLVVVKPSMGDFSIDPEAADKIPRNQFHTGFSAPGAHFMKKIGSSALFGAGAGTGVAFGAAPGTAVGFGAGSGTAVGFGAGSGTGVAFGAGSGTAVGFGAGAPVAFMPNSALCADQEPTLFGGVLQSDSGMFGAMGRDQQSSLSMNSSTRVFGGPPQQQFSFGFGSPSGNFDTSAFRLEGSNPVKKCIKKKKQDSSGFDLLDSRLRPGLNTLNINTMVRSKVNLMQNEEKSCVVSFDEIRLKRSFESVAQDEQGRDKEKEEIDHGLVFFVRGLRVQWSMPLCYFLSLGSMKADILKNIIVEVIQKLQEIGLHPRVLTCDHSFNNRKALSALGASLINPSITVNNTTIYTCYDVPHLLNSLRNNFMNTKLQILVNGNQVSWSDVIQVYELNKTSLISPELNKITDKHIQPTLNQRKNLNFAREIFSKTVATAIKSAVQTNQFSSNTANYTAMFIEKMNDIFDVLNSKNLHNSFPQKGALSILNLIPANTLQEAEEFFTSMEIYVGNKERKYIYSTTGFIWTIKSVLEFWKTLQREHIQYLLTGRLNLTPIQNLFSQINYKNGTFALPSFEDFRTALEENIKAKLNTPVGPLDFEPDEVFPLGHMDDIGQMEQIPSDYSDYDE